jgi:hypothetical protein
VPAGDCFQLFQQCQAGELVFDREYLSPPARSEDFTLFHITAGGPAARPASVRFCPAGRTAGGSPGLRQQDIMVVITTTGLEDWSFGNGQSALPECDS